MPNGFDRVLGRLDKAASKALDRNAAVTGTPDEDLVFYENLKPEDFKALDRQYGRLNTDEYIRVMEMKRMENGKGR